MNRAVVLAFVAPLVIALFSAGVNLSVWKNGRAEAAHWTLGLACLAGTLILLGNGLLYAADTRGEAVLARTATYLCVIPVQLASVRLLERIFRAKLPRAFALSAALPALWALGGLVPGWLHGEGVAPRAAGLLAIEYVDVELTALGTLAPLSLLLCPFAIVWQIQARARKRTNRAAVVVAGLASSVAAGSDLLVLGGWIDAPFLFPLTFTAAMVFYTGLMLRRFVTSLERVEASADLLQRAAEARAAELREVDLRLAHGARLAALGTLAASLAHEINNPAAFIRANLNYLAEQPADDPTDAERAEILQETEEGVSRLRAIVEELLRMSAHRDAASSEVRLAEVVESALPALRFEAGTAVAIEARLAPAPPVRGDRNLLGQVVTNLVINAIQAVRSAEGRGAVRISTYADEQRACLEVSDTGPGVPPELAQRVFEPFFTTKPAGQGTGLGLAVTRQLVERHGGRLALVSSERGARFRVELPIARPGARVGAGAAPNGACAASPS